MIRTRSIKPSGSDFTVNYMAVNRDSRILVQLADEQWKPIPGFTFEESIPLTGDQTAGKPAWQNKTLRELTHDSCKI